MTGITPTAPPILHDRYRIEEQLGTSRLAAVYRAYDQRLQRTVLVHLLRKELVGHEALRQRFIQEAYDGAHRSHQSLLEVFDSGEIAGRPYMITEYVAGRTLRELGTLSLEEALLYFRQVVGAVAVCQIAGVPHPPISSSNIILVEDGHVELVESWQTPQSELALDLAAYRAPERAEGGLATAASAVYSLGLLLFEMLTGRRAIAGDDPRAVAQAHLTARVAALSEVRPLLYIPSLEQLLQRATARRPEQRPRDATALGQALDDLRRDITGETQRLQAPPVRAPTLRERINRTAGELVAPPPVQRPPAAHKSAAQAPAHAYSKRRRSINGIVIVLTLLLVVACGAYYGASLALAALTNIELPRPTLDIPSLPDLGIALPEWLTGIVSGGGEVLVVNGAAGLNLRDAPGLNSNVIAGLPEGTHVRKLEGPRVVDGVPWVRIRANLGSQDLEGWVSERYVKPE
jgi:eukaryotic-like serine/threonine-protein kinase